MLWKCVIIFQLGQKKPETCGPTARFAGKGQRFWRIFLPTIGDAAALFNGLFWAQSADLSFQHRCINGVLAKFDQIETYMYIWMVYICINWDD